MPKKVEVPKGTTCGQVVDWLLLLDSTGSNFGRSIFYEFFKIMTERAPGLHFATLGFFYFESCEII